MIQKSEIEIEERIRRIDNAMAQEGMPLDDELKYRLYRCFSGNSTLAAEREKTLMKYKKFSFGDKKKC